MASLKLPNCGVGVYAYLLCILRHCGVRYVRLIPQDSESRRLAYLRALHPTFCLAISFADFLRGYQF